MNNLFTLLNKMGLSNTKVIILFELYWCGKHTLRKDEVATCRYIIDYLLFGFFQSDADDFNGDSADQ